MTFPGSLVLPVFFWATGGALVRTRIFVDFWNFSLNWKRNTSGERCDWTKVPQVLLACAERAMGGLTPGSLTFAEMHVYASCERGGDPKLRSFLTNFLDRQPGVTVTLKERTWRAHTVHCRSCGADHERCPACSAKLGRAVEKGVDTQMVTDMLSLAWTSCYEVGVLLTSDADFIPAVENLQSRNMKIVNATWKGNGYDLATKSWAFFHLDGVLPQLYR